MAPVLFRPLQIVMEIILFYGRGGVETGARGSMKHVNVGKKVE